MGNFGTGKSTRSGLLGWLFIATILTPSLCAQTPRRLQVELGPNQRIRILISNVSYGEVLRALGKAFDWEIHIPALADELEVPYLIVISAEPRIALAKLLEGSKLGYSFMDGSNGLRSKVLIIPSISKEEMPSGTASSDSSATADVVAKASSLNGDRSPALTASPSPVGAPFSEAKQPGAMSTKPLSEAASAMGVPLGVTQAEVGKTNVFAMSDAARTIGLAPTVSPSDLGRTIILPMTEAARMMGVPTISFVDIGKSVTAPVPTGPGKHP
jgi:hypothetical protein